MISQRRFHLYLQVDEERRHQEDRWGGADHDDGHYSFRRLEADVQHYISLYRGRRVLALRAHASVSDAADGGDIPFYLQRSLGGPDDLRGFRRFRFRDRHLLLLQADVTQNNDAHQALLKLFSLVGPPGLIVFDAQGREILGLRVVGYPDAERFLKTLELARAP